MLDGYGSAVFGGFSTAVMNACEIDEMDGCELCLEAESLGIDLRKCLNAGFRKLA